MTSPRLSDMIEDKESEDDNFISDHPDMMIRAISQHYSYAEPSSGEEFEENELEEIVSIDYTNILLPREQFIEDFYGEKGFTQWIHEPQYEKTVDALTVGYIKHNANNKQQRVMLSDVYNIEDFYGEKGFTQWIHEPQYEKTVDALTVGYIKNNANNKQQRGMLSDVYKIIVNYYSINTKSFNDYVEIQSGPTIFFTSMPHISLSKMLVSRATQSMVNPIVIKQSEVKTETLNHILEYLAHHKENEFDHTLAWTDRNSMDTGQIVSDEWDREW
eukprot:CAMPEP_0201594186 /NCGR_PEP_ID=MMETSP0190_2-20130828/191580_1 /ASSEMBLY_ACC=CAM_ASM_000263 /TAXON_ID=37353 /ORGANISM="Rosalina sp." /LENGTH=272 /DNA_ID=CAMNT_0048053703 /DNA_START=418 /DNA_END=1233 /DNA_ORIENTATION=+